MKCTGRVVFAVALCCAMQAFAGAKHDGAFLRDITMAVESPHLDWAATPAGGKLKVLLFVPRAGAGREVVELAQRLGMDYEAVACRNSLKLAENNIYESAVAGTSPYEKTREVLEKLGKPYDVMVLGNVEFKALPAEARFRILKHMADGGGLVVVQPRSLVYGKVKSKPVDEASMITAGIAVDGLPETAGAVGPDTLVKTWRLGKGRIVQLDYKDFHHVVYGGRSLTCRQEYGFESDARYENNMALVSRAVMWSADRLGRASVSFTGLVDGQSYRIGELDRLKLAAVVRAAEPTDGTLIVRWRSRYNDVVATKHMAVRATPDGTSVPLAVPALHGGRWYVDYRYVVGGEVQDFGYAHLRVVPPFGTLTVGTDKVGYRGGETVTATVSAEAGIAQGLTVRAELFDSPYGRLWEVVEQQLPLTAKSMTLKLRPGRFPTWAGVLKLSVLEGDRLLAHQKSYVFFPGRKLDRYVNLVWGTVHGEFPEVYARQVVQGLGWNNGLTHPAKGKISRLCAIFNQGYVPYMTRIGVQEHADKKGWTRQGFWWLGFDRNGPEIAALGDDHSFYRPKVRAMFKEQMDRRIEGIVPYGVSIYTLGDENHFQYSAGYGPADQVAFRDFLKTRYGTIANLNRQYGSQYKTFQEVKHYTQAEARAAKHYPGENDHRRFVERQYADIHHYLAECIKEHDPGALVGAEGSKPGNLELTISKLEYWGPYSDAVMDEVLRSIGADRIRTLWWGGYVGSHGGRNEYPFPLWKPLLQGAVNGNGWYSGSVGGVASLLGTDFDYAEYFKKMKPRLDKLQNGVAQLLISAPLTDDGVAILWSHDSLAASLMDDRFFSPRDSASAFMQACYALGVNFDYVTTSMVERGEGLEDKKVLFLLGASAISDDEAKAIEQFVRRGGVVIADLNPGVLNGYCRHLDKSQLSTVFGTDAIRGQEQLSLKPVVVKKTVGGTAFDFSADTVMQSPETETFVVNDLGRGRAVLLNFNLGAASNAAGDGQTFESFVASLLEVAGIKPMLTVQGFSRDRSIVRLRRTQGGYVLGILTAETDIGKTLTVELSEEMDVYRVDGGRLGRMKTVSMTVEEPFVVLGLFDNEPSAPTLELASTTIERGRRVALETKSFAPSGVYRLEVMGPDGKELPLYRQVISMEKGLRPTVRLALNEPAGRYRLVLTDVRTGLSTERAVEVK